MQFSVIHHIAINASDYVATKKFYVDQLGFEVIRETPRPAKNDLKLDLRLGDQELEIFIADHFPKRLTYPEALGLRHLAFKVENMDEALAELKAQGIEFEPVRMDELTNKKMTFFFDPDGLPLELHE
ncbi:VOC family protein [Weissella koreensis]|uniref:VOC family protein n=1 Tax=Weissella koreensis TaxID=165096 RepID=A0A7H1MMD3_9LACO|nr:VOC family protein [Weissella koreensis]AVH75415.1 VOC family protein [Weissella koreensis]EJF34393.1 lactoylglutathione lyase [Weissella koreensis KCTC 3621]QGN20640.1 VOC family protein [Weissella koreensis]QNT64619.1 VOC family protein [Weissella koreensis]